jgi:RNA polymerase sigma factor (TIGR02999 family)
MFSPRSETLEYAVKKRGAPPKATIGSLPVRMKGTDNSASEPSDIITLIQRWQSGSREVADRLVERLYPELKKIAGAYLSSERFDHTLAPTALVNELYLKFATSLPAAIHNRAHFFALAAQSLRHILVDYARFHGAKKRGGNGLKVTLTAVKSGIEPRNEDILGVDEALKHLQEFDPRGAHVVELRFFGGLDEEETAQVLGVSRNTAHVIGEFPEPGWRVG